MLCFVCQIDRDEAEQCGGAEVVADGMEAEVQGERCCDIGSERGSHNARHVEAR